MPNISKEELLRVGGSLNALIKIAADNNQFADLPEAANVIAMLQGLLAQPETEPFGFVREDYTDARFNTGHIFKKKHGDYSIAVFTHPAPFTPITADDVTDEMVNEYLTFMGKASYLRHPDVPYLGTAKNDSPEEWKLRFSKAAFAAAVNAWGAKK